MNCEACGVEVPEGFELWHSARCGIPDDPLLLVSNIQSTPVQAEMFELESPKVISKGVTQVCTHCGHLLPLTQFVQNPTYSTGRELRCKRCARRNAHALRHLTPELVRAIARRQRGCKVCFTCRPGGARAGTLERDHNHITFKFRGMICKNSNHAEGKLNKSVRNIVNLAAYIALDGEFPASLRDGPMEDVLVVLLAWARMRRGEQDPEVLGKLSLERSEGVTSSDHLFIGDRVQGQVALPA